MSLIKHRPRIGLLLPRILHPGQDVKAVVELDARHEVAIESLDVRFDGTEWGFVTTGMVGTVPIVQSMKKPLVSLGARLSGPRTLRPGKTKLPFNFSLPAMLPSSYQGRAVGASYEIDVHASIAWWPDARASFLASVQPPSAELPPRPVVSSTAPDGPEGREPFLEVSLADRNVASGAVLRGAVALGNVEHSRYTGLKLSLVGTERIKIGRATNTSECWRYTLELSTDNAGEGVSIPFSMQLPQVTPTTRSGLWRLCWTLEVRAERLLARALVASVEVIVLPSEVGKRDKLQKRRAAPSVGSERVRALWSSVAERAGFRVKEDELVQRSGDASLRLWREHRERGGLYLVGEVQFESLGLGLDGGGSRGFRRFLRASRVRGSELFEKSHYLVGRDPEQVQAFAEALGLWRLPLGGLRFADIDDEHMVLELRNAGLSRRPLEAMIGVLTTLARALPAARAAIPAPNAMRQQVDAWQELARELDGTLELARMIVRGRAGVHPARVVTEWDPEGKPERTLIELRPVRGIPGVATESWSEQPLTPGSLPGGLPRGLRRVLDELDDQALAVCVGAEAVVLARRAPQPEPLSALDDLDLLQRVFEAVVAGRGPYR